jgi:hypothetical protein
MERRSEAHRPERWSLLIAELDENAVRQARLTGA